MIKPDLAIWQDISSEPVSPRKEWFMSRQKNQMVVLPKLFTHLKTEKQSEKRLDGDTFFLY